MVTAEECIKVIIVHQKMHFFSLVYVSKYCVLFVWKTNKFIVWEYVVLMNDFHLCTLVSA